MRFKKISDAATEKKKAEKEKTFKRIGNMRTFDYSLKQGALSGLLGRLLVYIGVIY